VDSEIFYGYIPMLVGAAGLAASLWSLIRDFRLAQFLFALAVAAGMGTALVILYSMMHGGYPTYAPHIMIVGLLPVVIGQLVLAFQRRRGS
jgi:hypothetical protein